ncbi:MAG: 30S ribosomal protein S2 [Candidatus Aenigmarchaeota archaeon]|nr:30S ribosomal protein S2 [Candidatus Aenigmarchaeota archaeon]
MAYENYLSSGMHIGTKQITKEMKRFVYKIRDDGLAIINLPVIEKRIKIAANFLSDKKRIMIVSRKPIAFKAIDKFAEAINGKSVKGRFLAGTITNPNIKDFYEPEVLIVIDPMIDKQAVKEAIKMRIPIIALTSTGNETNGIDLIIPINNKGKKSIAMALYLLALETLLARKSIPDASGFKYKPEDFEGLEQEKTKEKKTEKTKKSKK